MACEEDAAALHEAFEQELELVESMYAPEECQLTRGSPTSSVRLDVRLERVRVELKVTLPAKFPLEREGVRADVVGSRGLIDSQEGELKRALEQHALGAFDEIGQHSLVGLLLHAQALVQELEECGGRCAICLDAIEDDLFRASCWHIFHQLCFAAWWQQLDERRRASGTRVSEATHQQQQSISAAQARLDAQQAVLDGAMARVDVLKSSRQQDLAYAETLRNLLQSDKTATLAHDPDATPATFDKRAAAAAQEIKTIKAEVPAMRAKLVKAEAELSQAREQAVAKDDAVRRRPVDCPLCRVPINFEELEPFLDDALASLAPVKGTLVPSAWAAGPSSDSSSGRGYLDALSEEEREAVEAARRQREEEYAKQEARGALIDRQASNDIVLPVDAPPAPPGSREEQHQQAQEQEQEQEQEQVGASGGASDAGTKASSLGHSKPQRRRGNNEPAETFASR